MTELSRKYLPTKLAGYVGFVVQAIVFKQTGKYIKHQEELLTIAMPSEQEIINTFLSLKNGGAVDFTSTSERLFIWAKRLISETI